MKFNVLDIVIIGVLVIPAITGLFKGMLRTVFGLVGLVGGVLLSIVFARPLGLQIANLLGFTDYFVGKLAAFILIFLASALIGYLGGIAFKRLFSAANLGWLDRLLGGLLGLAQGAVIATAILIVIYLIPGTRPWLGSSAFCKPAAQIVVQAAHRLPEDWTDYLSPERWIGVSRQKILEVLAPDAPDQKAPEAPDQKAPGPASKDSSAAAASDATGSPHPKTPAAP